MGNTFYLYKGLKDSFLGVRYFLKGNFPIGNLQKVILGPLRLCMLQWGPSAPARMARGLIAAARADLEGQELWLTHSWEVVAW